MALKAAMTTFDCVDAQAQASWWTDAVGGEVTSDYGDFVITRLDPFPVAVAFQRVDEPRPGKNRLHWDLMAPDRPAAVAALEAKGARRLAEHSMDGGFTWTVMADPEGNEFCVGDAESGEA